MSRLVVVNLHPYPITKIDINMTLLIEVVILE